MISKERLCYFAYRMSYPIIDIIVISFSIIFSYKFYYYIGIGQKVVYNKSFYFPLSVSAALFIVIVMSIMGVYKRRSSILNVAEIRNTIKSITLSYLLFSVILALGKVMLSRYFIVFSYIYIILFVVSVKMLIYNKFNSLIPSLSICRRALIYGASSDGQTVFRELVSSPRLLSVPVGFIDDDPAMKGRVFYQSGYSKSVGLEVLSDWKGAANIIETQGIDEIYVALPSLDSENISRIVDSIQKYDLSIYLIPELYDLIGIRDKKSKIRYLKLEQDKNYNNCWYLRYKRCLDLSIALISFVFLPFFLFIALMIKLDSKGSVLFCHDRVGRHGNLFRMYKFRTMKPDTDKYEVSPLHPDDPRITRFGRFLRRTSLDEIPQIINVLKGEMSFVGPRPEMPFVVEEYDNVHKQRLQILPGITGLWQLSADRSMPIHHNIYYDIYYIHNASFFMDIAIMLNTLIFPFKGI